MMRNAQRPRPETPGDPDEDRRADQGRHDADADFSRGNQQAPGSVRQQQDRGAEEGGDQQLEA